MRDFALCIVLAVVAHVLVAAGVPWWVVIAPPIGISVAWLTDE